MRFSDIYISNINHKGVTPHPHPRGRLSPHLILHTDNITPVLTYVKHKGMYVVELSGLPYFWRNLVQPCSFPSFNISKNRVEFFLSERSKFYVQLLTNNSGDWFMRNFRWVSK